jgi:methyltransferase (TIGR00027 family)
MPRKLALTRLASAPALRGLTWWLERSILPGLVLHQALRKRFIEQAARTYLAQHDAQLVVLGAGFDSLALRIAASRPRTVCIEVDHADTQEPKRRALTERAPPNLELVAADLARTSLADALRPARSFIPGRPIFFVLEGVTMYLPEASVVRSLEGAAALGKPSMQIAWTFMVPRADGRIAFRSSRRGWVNAWLASRGEPFTWGTAPDRLPAFVEAHGLRMVELADASVLRSRYLSAAQASRPVAEGELCCLCETR